MNRSALRYAFRQFTCYFLLLIGALYVWAGVQLGQATNGIWAACFFLFAIGTVAFRYRDEVDRQTSAIERATYSARVAEQRAEHQAFMDQMETERKARETERADRIRAEVLSGDRCPAWCDSCDEERRESDRKMADWLRERAQQHGHPNAADREALSPLAVLDDIEDLHQERLDGLAELGRKLHPGYTDESPI